MRSLLVHLAVCIRLLVFFCLNRAAQLFALVRSLLKLAVWTIDQMKMYFSFVDNFPAIHAGIAISVASKAVYFVVKLF
jgi:hypothetical protein